jgi:hypothetical protein
MTPLRVLLVTYSFPPAGGVGVLRAASLARYLPPEGIRLDVLTTRNASAVGTDSKLLQDIPSAVTIHRTTTLDLPFGVKKWIKTLISTAKPAASNAAVPIAAGKPNFLKRSIQEALHSRRTGEEPRTTAQRGPRQPLPLARRRSRPKRRRGALGHGLADVPGHRCTYTGVTLFQILWFRSRKPAT